MRMLTISPGGCANVHLHEARELAIYQLKSERDMKNAEQFDVHLRLRAAEFLYLPTGASHLAANPSATDPVPLFWLAPAYTC